MSGNRIERILLIDIDNDINQERQDSSRHQEKKFAQHPLGLMYIASAIRSTFPNMEIKLFHTVTHNNPLHSIKELIPEFKPDLVGLRSLSVAQDQFKKVATIIKDIKTDIPVIAGGPYPTSSYKALLTEAPAVDLVVMGEGEITMVELIKYLQERDSLPLDLPGTVSRQSTGMQINPPRAQIKELDTIPFPAYDLIQLEDYKGLANQSYQDSQKSAHLYTSRGCPYRCFYCHQVFGKNIRRRTAENVVAEMKEHIEKRGIRSFDFNDDLFNVPQKKAKEILRLIIRELPKVVLNFPNGLRADQLDEETIDLLEEAGTVRISLAVETASPRLQKILGKNLNLEKTRRAIELVSRKFVLTVFFMMGFPTETYEEVMQTINFAKELDHICQPNMFILRVYRGTSIYNMLDPDEEQKKMIIAQESNVYSPTLASNPNFYGDYFPEEKVPLNSELIKKLRWQWFVQVVANPKRTNNTDRILNKHLTPEEVTLFYQNYYDVNTFNNKRLAGLIKTAN